MKTISKSLVETENFVYQVLKKIEKGTSGATVLALSGDLGSGKTAFTKIIAKSFGITEIVNSPTFVLMKKYPILENSQISGLKFETLVHIDAYRFESAGELSRLGWQELIDEPKNLIVVEWAEKVKKILPKNSNWIYFEFIDDKTRSIELKS